MLDHTLKVKLIKSIGNLEDEIARTKRFETKEQFIRSQKNARLRSKILAKFSVAIPPSHLVQKSDNLKSLLYDDEKQKPDIKMLDRNFPEYSVDDKKIPNNVHFNISVLGKMEDQLLEKFQDLPES